MDEVEVAAMALYESRFRSAFHTGPLTVWLLHAHNTPIPDHGGDNSGANLCDSRSVRAIGPSHTHLLNIRLRIGFRVASRGLRAVSNRSPPHSPPLPAPKSPPICGTLSPS